MQWVFTRNDLRNVPLRSGTGCSSSELSKPVCSSGRSRLMQSPGFSAIKAMLYCAKDKSHNSKEYSEVPCEQVNGENCSSPILERQVVKCVMTTSHPIRRSKWITGRDILGEFQSYSFKRSTCMLGSEKRALMQRRHHG